MLLQSVRRTLPCTVISDGAVIWVVLTETVGPNAGVNVRR